MTTLRNRYRILQKLGSDGFGDIYLAEDSQLLGKPRCVVKHLKPQQPNAIDKAQELFEREAETLYKSGKKNQGIPEFFAYFEEGGEFYLVQKYIEGQDLSQTLARSGSNYSAVTPQYPRRRQFLSWLTFGGMGFGVAVLSGSCTNTKPKVTTTQTFTTVKVNPQGQTIEKLPGEAEVLAENLGNGVSLEMVSIPGGRFLMGSPENEEGREESEGPQRRVDVPPFFMGKHPVTQAQYEAVIGNNPSRFRGRGANHPVENVNWNDATEFCQKLSQRTGKAYRLPSEAEWEYACRAGTTTPFYFGPTITTDLVNYDGGYLTYGLGPKGVYRIETTDVGSFPPNAFGLYDLHGNVWEWCQDVWHENYNGAPTDGSAWESDGDSSLRILRGGSWHSSPGYCRSANRLGDDADNRDYDGGFRVVLMPGV